MNRPPIRSAMETPPLTRGRLFALSCEVGLVGNTPAYAGKTPSQAAKVRRDRKHPRLRGEDFGRPSTAIIRAETPPLTRGRQLWCGLKRGRIGNTPAYAGKTGTPSTPATRPRKHPRLRGEDELRAPVGGLALETPPLTRGRQSGRWSRPKG